MMVCFEVAETAGRSGWLRAREKVAQRVDRKV
jgi:hypothetical protein